MIHQRLKDINPISFIHTAKLSVTASCQLTLKTQNTYKHGKEVYIKFHQYCTN